MAEAKEEQIGFDPLDFAEGEDYSEVVIPRSITDSKLPAGWASSTGDDLVIEDPSIAKREKIAKHERDIKRQASIPAYMIRNTAYLAGGVLEGISSPFESLAMSLSSRGEISKLLDSLERDDVTWAQRQTVRTRKRHGKWGYCYLEMAWPRPCR